MTKKSANRNPLQYDRRFKAQNNRY